MTEEELSILQALDFKVLCENDTYHDPKNEVYLGEPGPVAWTVWFVYPCSPSRRFGAMICQTCLNRLYDDRSGQIFHPECGGFHPGPMSIYVTSVTHF